MAQQRPSKSAAAQLLMRDRLGAEAIKQMATALVRVYPDFDARGFRRQASKGLDKLGLKERVEHLIEVLHRFLPKPYPEAARILRGLPEVWERPDLDEGAEPSISSFAAWPLIDYSARYGLEHPDDALDVLLHLTPLFSAEFAIRPFLDQHPEKTFEKLQQWVVHPDPHVRRLVSEGTRPKLPWGKSVPSLAEADAPTWALLDRLREDPSPYVRRSVANHWNDLSKMHPESLLDRLQAWKGEAESDWSELQQRSLKHTLRSLIKAGHPRALALMGIRGDRLPSVLDFNIEGSESGQDSTCTLQFGHALQLHCSLLNPHAEPIDVLLDVVVLYRKANGSLAPKVFKGKRFTLAPGQRESWSMRRPFQPISTRRYHAGTHRVGLRINGQDVPSLPFELVIPDQDRPTT